MGIDSNKQLVQRLLDKSVNVHRADLLDRFVHTDVRVHPATPGTAPDTAGVEALREAFGRFRDAFPDLHITAEELIGEKDLVVARWTATGTHTGELAGIAATGTTVRWDGIDIYRLVDGKIAEWWRNDDFVWLLHQLGRPLVPAPE